MTETYHFGCPCVSIFIIMQIGLLTCDSLPKQLIVIFSEQYPRVFCKFLYWKKYFIVTNIWIIMLKVTSIVGSKRSNKIEMTNQK